MSTLSLTSQESLSRYGTASYAGWGQVGADADFNAKGGSPGSSGTSTGNTANDYLTSAVNSFTSLVQNPKPYEEVNPFYFDEALAKESAKAEYAPYYAELLTDYTQNVERTKSRSSEDLKSVLEQLTSGKEYYTGVQRRALDTATRKTSEGYAGNGLFFAGARERDIKELKTESEAQVGNYLSNYNYNVAQANKSDVRTQEDQDTALSQYTRDIGREEKEAEAGQVLQQKNEALTEYGIKKEDYYRNAYGTYA